MPGWFARQFRPSGCYNLCPSRGLIRQKILSKYEDVTSHHSAKWWFIIWNPPYVKGFPNWWNTCWFDLKFRTWRNHTQQSPSKNLHLFWEMGLTEPMIEFGNFLGIQHTFIQIIHVYIYVYIYRYTCNVQILHQKQNHRKRTQTHIHIHRHKLIHFFKFQLGDPPKMADFSDLAMSWPGCGERPGRQRHRQWQLYLCGSTLMKGSWFVFGSDPWGDHIMHIEWGKKVCCMYTLRWCQNLQTTRKSACILTR